MLDGSDFPKQGVKSVTTVLRASLPGWGLFPANAQGLVQRLYQRRTAGTASAPTGVPKQGGVGLVVAKPRPEDTSRPSGWPASAFGMSPALREGGNGNASSWTSADRSGRWMPTWTEPPYQGRRKASAERWLAGAAGITVAQGSQGGYRCSARVLVTEAEAWTVGGLSTAPGRQEPRLLGITRPYVGG